MSLQSLTDQELLARMLPDNDADISQVELAWYEFITRFEKPILQAIKLAVIRTSKRSAITNEDIGDLMQQVFIKLSKDDYAALRNFKFRDEHSLKAYLKVVAVNTAYDYIRALEAGTRLQETVYISELRAKEHRREFEDEVSDLVDNRLRTPEELIIDNENVEKIYTLVEKLSGKTHRERNRRIFELIFEYGYSVEDLVESNNVDLGPMGIYAIIHRIKKGLTLKLSLSG